MIAQNLKKVQARIRVVDKNQQVTLIAVSKTKPATDLQQAIDAGQRHFGENYLQEALDKIAVLKKQATYNSPLGGRDLIWHFIGPIQSNKTLKIAQNFDWVHSIDRLKIAKRLNEQRPKKLPKLKVLLQINIDNERTKSGILVDEIDEIIAHFDGLQNLTLKGFMCIPNPSNSDTSFAKMKNILVQYSDLEVLSMGMSQDLESAIENGATFVRIGTDIFGKRK